MLKIKNLDTLKQIIKMISSGEIPKEIYDKYLSKCPIGFMNEKDLFNYLVEKVEISMFQVGDKVRNGSLTGTIVQIKKLPTTTSGYGYLVKYPIREVKRLFHRKLWTGGLCLEKLDKENRG